MADVRPFRGVRYNQAKVGDLAQVVCPPYDIISPPQQRQLQQRSPYNAVRLELGETQAEDTADDDRYTRSRRFLDQWLADAVLRQEPSPALYLVEEEFPAGDQTLVRRSLFAAVRLEELGGGVILPHERTRAAAKRDRLALMQACQANFSPVMALYRDPSGRMRKALRSVSAAPPDAELAAHPECRYRLRVVRDQQLIDAIHEALAPYPLYLADGHHRYETALTYRDMRRAQEPGPGERPYDFVLMALIDLEDPGLRLYPYHRLLRGLAPQALDALRARIKSLFHLEPVAQPARGAEAIAKAVVERLAQYSPSQTAIGVVGLYPQGPVILTRPDATTLDELARTAPSPALRNCEPWLLQEGVLGPALGIRGEEEAGAVTLDFLHDADEATRLVSAGEYQVAFLMRAVPLELLEAVVQDGALLPPKSTYFAPKLLTGLVLNLLR